MNMHGVLLYGCAVAVIGSGIQLLTTLATKDGAETPPPLALLQAWRHPVPRAATALLVTMVVLGVAQTAAPAMIDTLERHPHGAWWRAVTALLVQSSGWFQLLFNLAALAVVAPIAERQFGAWRTLLIFSVSGVTAQAVSMAGWSLQGGGDSVAICGLVGALATWYAARGSVVALRRTALAIPAAGLVLCLLTNNHGVGLVIGSALGAGLATPTRPPLTA
ncbi:rhomboid family intramembrane serine protease [Streptomyces sp. GXMU-J15]|uniref:Rhomboid family intramembrane serine protease n=1 Tax=Streptomyces fuscus TaxID=3048495 RepID=A0ABT7JAJ5_9ACTN|nr:MULTISPECIES: rhomboid family intramembrane serine protease [Streptomyces]MDL2081900.1 rhomboid family intramembrane serine protease [Streptomyces fuscus]SBT95607.1 rhomboid protease GluP [Streptomyces sp. DI166]